MKFFLQNSEIVRLVTSTKSFFCTPERFQELEPDYPGLPNGITLRYWTPEFAYDSDGVNRSACPVNCGTYVDKIDNYTTYPVIYAHVTLSKSALCINADPIDSIIFDIHIKGAMAPEAPDLPVTQDWIIRLSHEDGLKFDGFHAPFVNGECSKIYVYKDGLPLGDWYVDESLFDLVTVGATTYQIKLAQPVKYTLYREFNS